MAGVGILKGCLLTSGLFTGVLPAPADPAPAEPRSMEGILGVRILLDPSIGAAERQHLDERARGLENLPRAKAVAELFQGYDFYLLFEASPPKGGSRLKTVWVYPHGAAPHPTPAESAELEGRRSALGDLQAALSRSPEETASALTKVLSDGDDHECAEALRVAEELGLEPPSDALQGLYRKKTSETLHCLVFEAMIRAAEGRGESIQGLIDLGLRDPSPLVQARAMELDAPPPEAPAEADSAPPNPAD